MNINIQIDDERIVQLVEQAIVEKILADNKWQVTDAKYGVRTGTEKAVKEYIYKNKDTIIEKVIERATVEIVKKALPKLVESLGGEK